MGVIEILLIILLGLAISTISSMLGLGGGFLIVPALFLIFHLPSQQAVGISLMAVTFTALSATLAYAKQKRIDYKLGLLLDSLDVPGVIVGAYLTTLLTSKELASLFGVVLLATSIYLIKFRGVKEADNPEGIQGGWRREITDSSGRKFKYVIKRPAVGLLGSFASGLVSGMCGIGGGIVDVSAMIVIYGVPTHIAVATSMFGMAVTNTAGALTHHTFGHILYEYALPLIIGVIFGAQIGVLIAKRLKGVTLKKIFGAATFLVGIRMILTYFMV